MAGPWYNPSLFFVVMEGRLRILGSYTQELQTVVSVAESSDEARKRLNRTSGTIGHRLFHTFFGIKLRARSSAWIERRTSNP